MKFHPLVPILTLEFVCLVISVSAQNLPDLALPTVDRPAIGKVEASPADTRLLYQVQKSRALDALGIPTQEIGTAFHVDLLRQPSIYREISKTGLSPRFEDSQELLGESLALLSATYREPGTPAGREGCGGIARSIGRNHKIEPEAILETVAAEVAANPSCACEIVKSAIQASPADPSLVVAIVETSIIAAPDQMRVISQCAIATAPESLAAIQELLAKLDPNAGESGSSSKGAKSAINARDSDKPATLPSATRTTPNPLDRLWINPIPPMLILTPPVTEVDPRTASQ